MSNRILLSSICIYAAFTCDTAPAAETASSEANVAPVRMLKSDYRMAKDRIESEYRAAKRICEGKKEAEERPCSRDTEAAHEKAEKDLKAAFYGPR